MRASIFLVAAFAVQILTGCAQMAQQAARDANTNATNCIMAARSTPEGQLLSARIWRNDGTDTAAKLSDPNPLSKNERDALVAYHSQTLPCRQIVLEHDNKYAAWETPYWQELFQRTDAIFYKLASGEISVGLANKLAIESNGKFQVDVSRGHADAVRVEEAQRQQAAQAMLQALSTAAQSQPHMTTTNCMWFGNTLNCTSMR
jgi:hypothetical protein